LAEVAAQGRAVTVPAWSLGSTSVLGVLRIRVFRQLVGEGILAQGL